MFSASKAGPQAREMVWQFTKEKWEVLKERYKGQFLLSRIIDVSPTTSRCCLEIANINQIYTCTLR